MVTGIQRLRSWGRCTLSIMGWLSGLAATCTRSVLPLDFFPAGKTRMNINGGGPLFSFVRLQERLMRLRCRRQGLIPRIVEIDGDTSIHVWLPNHHGQVAKNEDKKTGAKQPVLLLHGFGASAIWQWQGQLSLLCPHYDVYMPDLIFFGESTTKSDRRTEVFQAECMHQLMKTVGVERYDVVGISYGGFVAYRLATMEHSPVTRLALTACGLLMTPSEFDSLLGQGGGDYSSGDGRGAGPASILLPTTPDGVWRLMKLAYHNPLPVPTFLLVDALQNLFVDNLTEKRELLDDIAHYIDSPPDQFIVPKQVKS